MGSWRCRHGAASYTPRVAIELRAFWLLPIELRTWVLHAASLASYVWLRGTLHLDMYMELASYTLTD